MLEHDIDGGVAIGLGHVFPYLPLMRDKSIRKLKKLKRDNSINQIKVQMYMHFSQDQCTIEKLILELPEDLKPAKLIGIK